MSLTRRYLGESTGCSAAFFTPENTAYLATDVVILVFYLLALALYVMTRRRHGWMNMFPQPHSYAIGLVCVTLSRVLDLATIIAYTCNTLTTSANLGLTIATNWLDYFADWILFWVIFITILPHLDELTGGLSRAVVICEQFLALLLFVVTFGQILWSTLADVEAVDAQSSYLKYAFSLDIFFVATFSFELFASIVAAVHLLLALARIGRKIGNGTKWLAVFVVFFVLSFVGLYAITVATVVINDFGPDYIQYFDVLEPLYIVEPFLELGAFLGVLGMIASHVMSDSTIRSW